MAIFDRRINADKAPFFVQKLNIKTLPTVVLFVDGIAVRHIVGFADLGGALCGSRELKRKV
jgi:hypothetical protein